MGIAQIYNVSIAVYRGQPLDYQRYRHTALCFRPTASAIPSSTATANSRLPPSPPLSSASASSPPWEGTDSERTQKRQQQQLTFLTSVSAAAGPAIILHAVINNNNWEVLALANVCPANKLAGRVFAREVPVGFLSRPLGKARLVHLVSQTPVDNEDPEFNCQVWVEAALMRLVTDGLLGVDDYRIGFDAMVDATMEATDEITI